MTLLDPHDNHWRRPALTVEDASLRWLLEEAAAAVFGVAPEALHAAARGGADVAFARQCAMYLAHVVLALNYGTVGRLFDRDRTTVAHACRLVEDRRDDRDIDRRLDLLECVCIEAIYGPAEPAPVRQ